MKKHIIVVIFTMVLLLIGNNFYQNQKAKSSLPPQSTTQNQSSVINKPAQLTVAIVNIYGFDCPTCPISAEYALKDAKGVFDAKVTSSGEGSRVLYDATIVTIEDFKKVLTPFTIEVVSQRPSLESRLN